MNGYISNLIENVVCSWYGTHSPDTAYVDRLRFFLPYNEVKTLLRKKSKRIELQHESYLFKYGYIDDEYLFNLTRPLYITQKYYGKRYYEYLNELAFEIVEYKVLNEIKGELRQSIGARYQQDKEFRNRVAFAKGHAETRQTRPRKYLDHKFIDKVVGLANEHLGPDTSKEPWREFIAYILAKLGIFKPPCTCKVGRNDAPFKKPEDISCAEIDCFYERFKLLPTEKIKCVDGNPSDRKICNTCKRKPYCPVFHPCPTGLERYKKHYVRRIGRYIRSFSLSQCNEIISGIRWPDGDIACPECGQSKLWELGAADRSRYQCAKCDYKFSLISGTIFESRTPLEKWLRAIAAFNADNDYPATKLSTLINVEYKTALKMRSQIKENIGKKTSHKKDLLRLYEHLAFLRMEEGRYGITFSVSIPLELN